MKRIAFIALLATATGCTLDAAEHENENVGSTAAPLAAHDWAAPAVVAPYNHHNVAVAFIGGTAYSVFTNVHKVYFSRLGTNNVWSERELIPGVTTRLRVSVAAFNGKLYLLTEGPAEHAVRMSRFDPATQTWSTGSQLPFQSSRVPAMAVHDGRLFLLGTEPIWPTYPIWLASMGADGSFTPAQPTPLRGWDTALASYGAQLHATYTSIKSQDVFGHVRHAVFDGSAWGSAKLIPMGFGSSVLRGTPAMARYRTKFGLDCLHLVVADNWAVPADDSVWWTYDCGDGEFSVPVSIPDAETGFAPALAASAARLLVVYRSSSFGYIKAQSYSYPSLIQPFPLDKFILNRALSSD